MRARPQLPLPVRLAARAALTASLAALSAFAAAAPAAAQAELGGFAVEDPFETGERAAATAPPAAPRGIRVVVESPASGAALQGREHMVEVRGTAIAAGAQAQRFDVMLVLDVSQSTQYPSGADVDGDGVVGENPAEGLYAPGEFPEGTVCTDPDDTILAAEVAAARALVRSLSADRARVGLVSFSGEVNIQTGLQRSRDQRNATLEVPLTSEFGRLEGALGRVLARGPHGATDFSAGIRLATTELAGLSGAASPRLAGAQKVMLLLTDGHPTFPTGQATIEDAGDLEAAVNAAKLAKAAGIRINTYALGQNALGRPVAATEVARATLGTFTPVLEPGKIVAALQSVSFANVEDVAVVNLTLREDTPDVRLNPDGTFQAFVPVREGSNRVLVNALASDGSESNVELAFEFRVAQAEGAMRERELTELRKINTELLRQLEAERIKREKRRQRVEKELEIRGAE
ncbi:MAG TPA: vWA domain-containing protein [Myxococcota bacterium]|nr:vWA domain-containing protein [Myxococcota bacterium]